MSELYASLLTLGVTISLGSVAAGVIANQFGLTTTAAGSGATLAESSAGIQISFVYATAASTSGCPAYGGTPGGKLLEFTVFDYGATSFSPVAVALNGTVYYSPAYPALKPGGMVTYRLPLTPVGACAHPWGQTLVMVDSGGDSFQLET